MVEKGETSIRIPNWNPRTPELKIEYDKEQRAKYKDNDPSGEYFADRWITTPISHEQRARLDSVPASTYWHTVGGRAKHGEFPVVVARKYFRLKEYLVWGSEPRLDNGEGYVLLSFSGYRERKHESYRRMVKIFGEEALARLNSEADDKKRSFRNSRNRGGGDPDLFVFRDGERFFVEVKEDDELSDIQKLCFSLIEKHLHCEVRICRVCPKESKTTLKQSPRRALRDVVPL